MIEVIYITVGASVLIAVCLNCTLVRDERAARRKHYAKKGPDQ